MYRTVESQYQMPETNLTLYIILEFLKILQNGSEKRNNCLKSYFLSYSRQISSPDFKS